jgi:hypothetical protein
MINENGLGLARDLRTSLHRTWVNKPKGVGVAGEVTA